MKLVLRLIFIIGCSILVDYKCYAQKYTLSDFKKVDSLATIAQPKPALALINEINKQARAYGNQTLLIKSAIYKILFHGYLEEDSYSKVITELKNDIIVAKEPEKSLLQSLLAETYWKYYKQNRYLFFQRTSMEGSLGEDYKTWSAQGIVREITKLLLTSLTNESLLQQVNISEFKEILEGDSTTRIFRPTLYDLLANRALDILASTETDLSNLNSGNYFDDPIWLAEQTIFLSAPMPMPEPEIGSFYSDALQLFKKLMRFHLQQNNLTALADIDLKRLKYVYHRSLNPDKNQLYFNALTKLAESSLQSEVYADILVEIAILTKDNVLLPAHPNNLVDSRLIAEKAVATYPSSQGAINARNLIAHIKSKSLSIKAKELNLPNQPNLLYLTYKNIDTVYFSLFRIPIRKELDFNRRENFFNFLKINRAINKWSVVTPNSADHQTHTLVDQLKALLPGHYVLIAQHTKEITDDTYFNSLNFTVSTLAVTERKLNDQHEYHVFDGLSGNPLKDVNISEKDQYPAKKNIADKTIFLKTDNYGYVISSSVNSVKNVLFTYKGDSLLMEVGNYNPRYKIPQKQVILFTDRPIYRPGQTLYYKGIYIDQSDDGNSVLENESLELVFKDVNAKEIEKIEVTTNTYGTFQGSLTIPQGKLNGRMQLFTAYGQVEVQVEEYKRPTFEVVFDKSDLHYRLNDSVKVRGKAVSLSGYPLIGAKIKYTVLRTVVPDYFRAVSYQRSVQIAMGTTQTTAGGKFEINFLALDKSRSDENYTFQVKVDVIDVGGGETRTATHNLIIGKKDLMLNLYMPGQLILSKNPDTIKFALKNLNNEPIKGKVNVEWIKLVAPIKVVNRSNINPKPEFYTLSAQEFANIFPYEEYRGSSDPANWKTGGRYFQQNLTITGGEGNVTLSSGQLEPGYYKVNIIAINNTQDTIRQDRIVRIYHEGPTTIQNIDEWLTIEKTTVLPNEEAVFRIASPSKNGTAYYELYYKDKIIEKVWLNVGPKQQFVRIAPKEIFKDGFAVQFTMIHNGVIRQSLRQISYYNPSEELDIKFLSFRNKLQPGEKETWKLSIGKKNGEPQMAEMAATLYDASLDQFKAMNWTKINPLAYNYYSYTWHYKQNAVMDGNNLWFLSREVYFGLVPRTYEKIKYLTNGEYNNFFSSYQNYLQNTKSLLRKDRALRAAKKLQELQNGDKVHGVVMDELGYGLAGVSVKNGKITTTTDQFGIYALDAKFGDELELTADGFKVHKVEVQLARRLDVRLKPLIIIRGRGLIKRDTVSYGAVAAGSKVELKEVSTAYAADTGKPIPQGLIIADNHVVEDNNVYNFVSMESYDPKTNTYMINGKPVAGPPKIVARENFNETAFFFPQLTTNEKGEINIEFTIPQSLTRYKMLGFAHTKDLRSAVISNELITQKQVAITAAAPRFFREGDTLVFTAKLNNSSGTKLKGNAILELRDALNGKILELLVPENKQNQQFEIENLGNEVVKWPLIIPYGINAITYKVLAQAGKYTDGEEMTIPVLPNSTLITESMPLNVRGKSSKEFKMERLVNVNTSKTLLHQGLTIEFTSNPIWYAVQALPYLMEFPYECSEQTFSRFFANVFATAIINSSPKIKTIFNQWQQAANGTAMLSNLEKNQELKSILLEETPWVREANSETERKKRLATLFDLNRMAYEMRSNLDKLAQMQNSNGSFPWFTGMREDRYVTQHIVLGMGQLKKLSLIDVKKMPLFDQILTKAIAYLDVQLIADHKFDSEGKRAFSHLPIHYLWARSYVAQKNPSPALASAMDFYLKRILENWKLMEPFDLAQSALILNRSGKHAEALKIIELLKQTAQQSDEMGMYWKKNQSGWWWYQNPIETQSLLIEAFDEVASATSEVEEMKIWLLKNKQTNNWKTTKATTAACYALLRRGFNLLNENIPAEITIANQSLTALSPTVSAAEPGTGYQKLSIEGGYVKAQMGNIAIKNPNQTMAWGALYWQYFEQLDKVTPEGNAIKIKKQLFLEKQTAKGDVLVPLGSTTLTPGDLVKVRIEIYADREMEYVHLKDMRSSGFEPLNVISKYKYQGGLGYYESTKDASTNFFIGFLPKGVYVFEYPLRVTHAGNFSNGITSLQGMYAPEFTTHSEGSRVEVK